MNPRWTLSKTDGIGVETAEAPEIPWPARAMANGNGARAAADYTEANIRVLEGIEAIRQAPRHVHRRHDPPRPAPPGLRGRRQLDRRGDGRLLPEHPRDDPRRRLGLDRRRRPGHPGRHPPRVQRQEHARGRPDQGRTPAASSTTTPTRSRAACTASASRSSTRSRSGSRPRSTATGRSGGRSTSRASPRGRSAPSGRPRPPAPRSASSPTPTIFDKIDFDYDVLEKRLRELAYPEQGDRDPPDRRAGRRAQGRGLLLVGRAEPSSSPT